MLADLASILALTFSISTFISPSAFATSKVAAGSEVKSATELPSFCRVSARFKEARPKQGKAVWIFDRVEDLGPKCALEGARFEVWVWQGTYSALSRSIVYPIYIDEPKPGTLLDLELTHQEIRERPSQTRYRGWFFAPGEESKKVRAP
jgi:hypothetical protein